MTACHLSSSLHWYRKLSVVTLFELDDFLSESWPRITLHIGGQMSKSKISRITKDHKGTCCQKASCKKFQSWKEIWTHKECKRSKKNKMQKEHEKNRRKSEMKRNPKKNGLKWRWRETKKDKENDPSRDEKWSLIWSPWNTIWAYLSFLSKPWTLAYITCFKSPF